MWQHFVANPHVTQRQYGLLRNVYSICGACTPQLRRYRLWTTSFMITSRQSPLCIASRSNTAVQSADEVPLRVLETFMKRKKFFEAAEYVEKNFDASVQTLPEFVRNPCDVHDVIIALVQVYVTLGQMQQVRSVLAVALRDLRHPSQANGTASTDHLPTTPSALDSDHPAKHRAAGLGARTVRAAGHASQTCVPFINTCVFNAYLAALTRRKNFDKHEVLDVLRAMQRCGVPRDALTYHYLIELHVRAGYDPIALWSELLHEQALQPLPATVQTLLLRVVPSSDHPEFVVEVVREGLRCGSSVLDKQVLTELIEQWLHVQRSEPRAADSVSLTTPTPLQAYPPEYVMWLLLELEVRCVLDHASFVRYIQKQHVAQLLLLCAKCADATTAAATLALMDRHAMSRTADVLALVVWCWAQALELEKALDLVELMARKGFLDHTDPLRKFVVDCLHFTMERHFLAVLADAISSVSLLDRAMGHLATRRRTGQSVSAHTLDVLVLAAGKLGEERRALHILSSYHTEWGVAPRTCSYNAALIGCAAHRGTMLHRHVVEAMQRAGVAPDPLTFRVLIRQAVLSDSIDEAVAYLHEVANHPGLRVEVEMILPIIERAARAGDVETVNRVSQYSLDCDIGIDGAVLQSVMKHLLEANQNVDVLRGHQPLHEALRSRSKVGRQRARSELVL